MAAAYRGVVENEQSLREMSNLYNVPVETLRRRVNGSVSLGCKPGPATILTDEEEDLLCKYIIELADMGYGLSKEDVQRLAFSLVEKMGRKHPFTNGMAGRGWFDGFKARHPQLSFRTPQALSFTRAVSANELAISDFFAKLGGLYGRLNLINKPMQIFNADETGVSVVHKQGKVLAQLGRRHVSTITSAEKGKTHTVLSCISAVGQVLPPMIVYPRKQRVPDSLKNDCVPDTYFACSGNGWINSELYLEWFKFFLKHISPTRPVLLVQDGHSSHISISLIELARENDVHLLCLPAHTTHILQPLDVGVFKSFKSNFSKVCHRYLIERPGQVITSAAIASLVHGAWFNSFTPVNIMSGFKKCGVYPLNPGEVSDRQLAPSRVAVQCESSDGSIKSNAQERKSTEYETVPESVSSQSSSNSSKTFTIEQLKLFQQRYNEGYDVKDPEYETWLKIHHPEIGTPPVGSSSSASDKSSIDVMKELLILPSKVQKKQNPLSGKSVCVTENHVLEQLKAKEAEKLRIAEERKIKMDERAKQKEARQIEKERKAMEREEKVKKKDKQKKEKQRAIKKPTGRKEILNLGDKDNTQCSFCEVFYQDDVTGDSWVCCDMCNEWYCYKCSGVSDVDQLCNDFYCRQCV